MCCLKNEQETYEYLNSNLPRVGENVKAKDGTVGFVHRVDVLRQQVKMIVEDEEGNRDIAEYKVEDLIMKAKKPQGGGCPGCKKHGKDQGKQNKQGKQGKDKGKHGKDQGKNGKPRD